MKWQCIVVQPQQQQEGAEAWPEIADIWARAAAAALPPFSKKYGDQVYKKIYGAKIIVEDRNISRVPVTVAKSESNSRKYL